MLKLREFELNISPTQLQGILEIMDQGIMGAAHRRTHMFGISSEK